MKPVFSPKLSRVLASLCLAAALIGGRPATAVIGTLDTVPAATLLIPYFEASTTGDVNAPTTLVFITNTNFASTVVNVVLWTNWGVPTLAFELPLTGTDVASFNIADIFSNGSIPGGVILSANALSDLIAKHTGQGIFNGMDQRCYGQDLGDTTARGYITVDVLNDPNVAAEFPTDAGYFVTGGLGKAGNENILWGEYFYVDPANNFAQSDTAVQIEADGVDARTSNAGSYTFYGRYVSATAADNREPLGHAWNIPYRGNPSDGESTQVIYWRDSTFVNGDVPCGATPGWFPLNQTQLVFFDEAENATDATPLMVYPFIQECGRVAVNGNELPIPYESGWLYVNSRQTFFGSVYGDDRSQSYFTVVHDSLGRFSTGFRGTMMDSAVNP